MDIKKVIGFFSFWQLLRIVALAVILFAIWSPIRELMAIKKSVVFFCGNSATLTWDPPSEGIVDHYIVKMVTTKPLKGSENYVSWANYISVSTNKFTWSPADGYNYSFRVRAVGPNGEMSDYSEDELLVICDCTAPEVNVNALVVNRGGTGSDGMTLKGVYDDSNIAYVELNNKKANLDLLNQHWQVGLGTSISDSEYVLSAYDYAGNTATKKIEILNEPIDIDSNPSGGKLYLMGSPEYPGRYFTNLPYKLPVRLKTSWSIPVTIKLAGMMTATEMVSFPVQGDQILFELKPFKRPSDFAIEEISTIDIGSEPDLFVVNFDNDLPLEILACSKDGVSIIDSGLVLKLDLRDVKGEPFDMSQGCEAFVIDYDDDLRYELVLSQSDGKGLALFELKDQLWEQSGVIGLEGVTVGCGPVKFAFQDWNNDDNKDLIVADCDGALNVFLNIGSDLAPSFGGVSQKILLAGRAKNAPFVFFDWDGDGDVDILSLDENGNIDEWENLGGWDFSDSPTVIVAPSVWGLEVYSFKCGDFNSDGLPDLVLSTREGGLFVAWGGE
ncbi:MAG TPA: hypothetical protein ENJ63_03195 [Dissulfuribacter thermophilus]|uniref:Fibronectin type-III domain-containing protein n=1 Tax=Dissulfuribacter thermophilus TaxID=1156395 RepID=A0A7V2SVT4_9BACT|nr:hypothetical protein [Dissulfuribacter thermophilus]